MSDDAPTSSPVREARDRCLEAKLRYDQGRHGLAREDLTVLRRQWQTYLWHYFDHIQGYKETDNIRELWREPIAPEQGHPDTLEELEPYQFAMQVDRQEVRDPFEGRTRVDEQLQPGLWPADALRAVQHKLDECYHRLGYDEPPKRIVPTSGPLSETNPEWFSEEITDDVFREFIEKVTEYQSQGHGLSEAYELVMDDTPETERTES